MKRAVATSSVVLAVALLLSGCRTSTDLSRPETQRQFGVRMAKMNLWREAMFRFQRAVELEPQNAMAYNNLAVAYEATGDFEAAANAYREALRLDRSNQYIQKNYSRFVEFSQRSKRRETPPSAQPQQAAPTPEMTPAVEPPVPETPAPGREPGVLPADAVPPTPTPEAAGGAE